jgi:hypothetical protein
VNGAVRLARVHGRGRARVQRGERARGERRVPAADERGGGGAGPRRAVVRGEAGVRDLAFVRRAALDVRERVPALRRAVCVEAAPQVARREERRGRGVRALAVEVVLAPRVRARDDEAVDVALREARGVRGRGEPRDGVEVREEDGRGCGARAVVVDGEGEDARVEDG